MMSRLKEKYLCVLVYACILQKLVGHWAMQMVIIDKHFVSEFREFYWNWVWQALTLQFAQAFLDLDFNGKTVFNRLLDNGWSNLYATLALSALHILVIFGLFWPKCASFFKREFFVWGKILKSAGIDQHHQGLIWTKNPRWLTPITSNS